MVDAENKLAVELTILGALLRDSSQLGEVMTIIKPEMFRASTFRPVYKAICELHIGGAPVDPISVRKRTGEEYGIVIEDAQKFDTADVLWYCRTLAEYHRLGLMHSAASELLAAEDLTTAGRCIDQLNSLTAVGSAREIISAADAVEKYLLSDKSSAEYVRWGIPQLDKHLLVELGDFVVLGGYASSGKTMLSLQFAATLARKYRVGYFSHETAPKKLAERIVSYITQIPFYRIKTKDLSEDEWQSVRSCKETLQHFRLDWIQASNTTVTDMQAIALNRHYDVIFIDYLQIVLGNGKGRYEDVTQISRDLHAMAQQHGILVVALAQLNRAEKTKAGTFIQPTLASFRESGQIEQDADVALILYPTDPTQNICNRYLKIAKNKDGRRDTIELEFRGATQTFVPVKESAQAGIAAVKRELKEEEQAKQYKAQQITFEEVENEEVPF